ncbi:unnamed protein product [Symbiodinium natans]|uniref:PDZ domain-containing protein n=1 Tax=Symbiodinium natans TaxID=878477 RepID=A0A812URP2_9DINO|nr:unnamed protein product [Symbiodinium natans]
MFWLADRENFKIRKEYVQDWLAECPELLLVELFAGIAESLVTNSCVALASLLLEVKQTTNNTMIARSMLSTVHGTMIGLTAPMRVYMVFSPKRGFALCLFVPLLAVRQLKGPAKSLPSCDACEVQHVLQQRRVFAVVLFYFKWTVRCEWQGPYGLVKFQLFFEKLRQLGPEVPHESLIQAMREVVLAEVEQKVQGKVEELWAKGKQAFSQAQQKQREQMQRVLEEVAQCQARQVSLAAENERLREALCTLSSKCSSLPGYVPDSLASPGSTLAGTPPLQEEPSYPARPFTPIPFAPVGDFPSYAGEAVLPEVPVMPLPSPGVGAPGAPAPLSLAEALGPVSTTQRTPLSLAESLVPESEGGSPQSQITTFSVTITKAADTELGLDVSHEPSGNVLRVDGIRQGAVQAWNQQCLASSLPEQVIAVGDKITCVNTVAGDPAKMLKACVSQQTLSLEIEREEWGAQGRSHGVCPSFRP